MSENSGKLKTASAPKESAEIAPELRIGMWSVISFDRIEANSLTYEDAEKTLAELESKKIPGLCIVTDDAAGRM